MEDESHTSRLDSQIIHTPAADNGEGHGPGSWFSRSTHVALTNPTIVNVLGSYYGNVGHGPNHGDAIAVQETLNHQHENINSSEQCTENRAGRPTVENMASKQTPEVKSAAELYRELGNRQYGTPLYIPQPNSKLSKPDRRDGIRPGCVGKITKSGSFDVLHNSIFRSLPTSDTGTPINQTPFDDEDIVEFKQFSAGSFLATPGIYRKSLDGGSLRTIASLGCDVDTQEGALLILPQGAYCEHFTNMSKLRDYISQSGPSLYAYANNVRGRQYRNGELSVVYNCHKSASWAIATFQNTSRDCAIKMNLVENNRSAHPGLQSAGAQYMWDYQGTVQAKIGPEDENDDLVGGDDHPQVPVSSLRNQCLFARTIKITLREDVWQQLFPEQDVIVGPQDKNIFQFDSALEQSTSLPPSSSPSPSTSPSLSPSSLFSYSELPHQDSQSIYTSLTSVSQFDSDNNSSRPVTGNDDTGEADLYDDDNQRLSDIVTTFLLEQKPEAKMAISDERNWASCTSLNRNASEILDDICAANDIYEQDGLVYFEPKEPFPTEEKISPVAEALKRCDGFLQEFLFGFKQSCEERCNMLTDLMRTLQEDRIPQITTRSRPTVLRGHALRTLNIGFILPCSPEQRKFFDPTLPIGDLRKYWSSTQASSEPNIDNTVHSSMLGQSLLRRFWNLGHEDDLHEAIFVLANSLAVPPAHRHQKFEIYLDLSLALFFRYQLFQQAGDLEMLMSVLQQQKDALRSSSCSWIWEEIDSLNPLLPSASVLNTAQQPVSAVGKRYEILDEVEKGVDSIHSTPELSSPFFICKQSEMTTSQAERTTNTPRYMHKNLSSNSILKTDRISMTAEFQFNHSSGFLCNKENAPGRTAGEITVAQANERSYQDLQQDSGTQKGLVYPTFQDCNEHGAQNPSDKECHIHAHSQYLDDTIHPPRAPISTSDYETYDPDPGEPSHQESEAYLRRTLSIPEAMPVNLWSLPDEPLAVTRKPLKISELIKLAIWGSPGHILTLREIFAAIEERYPSYKEAADKPWQRSIRHNLSLKAMFIRKERASNPGKGYYWVLNVRMGEGNKRDRKRSDPRSDPPWRDDDDYSKASDVPSENYTAGKCQGS